MSVNDKVLSALNLLDGLAEQWGDEGVFRRARDLLREVVKGDQWECCCCPYAEDEPVIVREVK